MMTGRERLAAWMDRQGLSFREAGRELGIHWTFLNHILLGRRSPGLATAHKIQRATGIATDVWLPTAEGKTGSDELAHARKRLVDK